MVHAAAGEGTAVERASCALNVTVASVGVTVT